MEDQDAAVAAQDDEEGAVAALESAEDASADSDVGDGGGYSDALGSR